MFLERVEFAIKFFMLNQIGNACLALGCEDFTKRTFARCDAVQSQEAGQCGRIALRLGDDALREGDERRAVFCAMSRHQRFPGFIEQINDRTLSLHDIDRAFANEPVDRGVGLSGKNGVTQGVQHFKDSSPSGGPLLVFQMKRIHLRDAATPISTDDKCHHQNGE